MTSSLVLVGADGSAAGISDGAASVSDDCARAVQTLWEAGADSVVVVPRHEDRAEQLSRFVRDVLPRVRA